MTKATKKAADVKVTETLYQMIKTPVITEKAANASQYNQVTFRVPVCADKPMIKKAVEGLFKVKVTGISTTKLKGKVKIFKGRPGQRSDVKKAIVTLAEGQSIDVATGV